MLTEDFTEMTHSVINGSSFNFYSCLLILLIFNLLRTLDELVTMATREDLSLIYEIQKFTNTYLGNVSKFQSNGLFILEF